MGAAGEMGDPPAAHHARQTIIGIVVQHHHLRAREMQLLDRAQADVVEAAHDHVTDPVAIVL